MYVQNDIERPRFKTDAFVTSLIPFSIASRDQRGISNPLANRCRRTSNCVKTKLLTNSSRIRSRLFTASSKSNWCSLIESGHFSSTIERSSLDFWLWVHPERPLSRTYICTYNRAREKIYVEQRLLRLRASWENFWKAATLPSPPHRQWNASCVKITRCNPLAALKNFWKRTTVYSQLFYNLGGQLNSSFSLKIFQDVLEEYHTPSYHVLYIARPCTRSAIDPACLLVIPVSGWITPRYYNLQARVTHWPSPTIVTILLQRLVNTVYKYGASVATSVQFAELIMIGSADV